MADENDDPSQKTEEPTQRRLEEAEKKGQIVFSREVNNFFMMLAFALILSWSAPYMLSETQHSFSAYITAPHDIPVDPHSLRNLLIQACQDAARVLAPAILLIVALAVGGAMAQSKFIFSLERITPKLEKISIIKGLGRLFSMRSVVEFLKGLIKMTIVGAVAFLVIWPEMDHLPDLPTYEVTDLLDFLSAIALKMVIGVCCIMFVMAVLDYLYQRHEYMKNLRMSKQELKEEYKQQEGDPHVKSRLRQIRMERARKRMMAAVPKADVVITNPTHFAVALQYDNKKMQAPIVVAKGQDKVALRIREVAEENDVPVVENPPLARALFASTDLDEEIPYEHYKAVAEVIGYVYRLRGKV